MRAPRDAGRPRRSPWRRVAALSVLLGAATPALTPAAVGGMLDRRGLDATSAALSADGGAGWDAVANGVAAGDAAWIALVPRLRGAGSASGTEGLAIALSDALGRNPTAVLRLERSGVPVTCGDRAIEPTPDEVRAYTARTIAAVSTVRDPSLARARDACLRALHATANTDRAR